MSSTKMKIKRIIRYVLPSVMGSTCCFLFTIVDAIFVGRGVGPNALGAMNLISPFIMIVSAMNMLINIGGVSIFAIHIGRGDIDGANKIFRHGMFLLLCGSVVLSFSGVVFTGEICTLLGAGETYYHWATDYLFWYALFIIPSALSTGLQNYCRNDGSPELVSIVVIVTTICNILGDWLLIYCIPMGTKGTAIATGISQTLGLFIILTHFARKQGILRFGRTNLEGSLLRDIITHGFPEGISQLATPVMTFCMNIVLIEKVGDFGINAFSVLIYVASFSMAVFAGTCAGLQPMFGQSYGAKDEKDLKFYFKAGLGISFLGSVGITLIAILFSKQICVLFGADASTQEYILRVLPIFAAGFVIMALNVMISSYLYSTERVSLATIISFLRSIVVSTTVILLLPRLFGEKAIWPSTLIYESIVLIIAVILVRHSERNGIEFK